MVQKDSLTALKERIIVIGGPTCIGKSDYAVELATKLDGEIISADSIQIYRGLDIGSGKITKQEMRGVPHHMIDIVDPEDPFTVVDFTTRAGELIRDIILRGKMPIIVGGTGFYINALLHGYKCGKAKPNPVLRQHLRDLEAKNGKGYLYDMLLRVNPHTKVKANDMPRIERQLEIHLSADDDNDDDEPDSTDLYDALLIIMNADRSKLDALAAKRISKMFDLGLVEEVKKLRPKSKYACMSSVGYKDVLVGLSCGMPREEMEESMRSSYHALIKKQQTFFRWIKWENKVVIYDGDDREANAAIEEFLRK